MKKKQKIKQILLILAGHIVWYSILIYGFIHITVYR